MWPSATASRSMLLYRGSLIRHRFNHTHHLLTSSSSFLRSTDPRRQLPLRSSASLTSTSWFSPPEDGGYNGWAAAVEASPRSIGKKGSSILLQFCKIMVAAFVAAAIAYLSLSRKGVKFRFRASESLSRIDSSSNQIDLNVFSESVPEATRVDVTSVSVQKLERVKAQVLVDSTQLEALSVLKKLKIIEDDVSANELCSRREYARWLVRINSFLERNPKHRIASPLSSGSVVAAFDDVGVDDPDFDAIQALAETGFISSKISGGSCTSDSSKGDESSCFHPERFISRQDLINWKVQLEYQIYPGITEQMSKTKVDYMDVKDIGSDASTEFLVDMLSGDNSIIRKVFGKSRRLQPNKPLTKAQAAVALTSGRMTEAVHYELVKLESENSARQAALKEIRSELLDKGDIKRFWDEKINEERSRGIEVLKSYGTMLHYLEQEKTVQEKTLAESLKEKAAMDCQRQLLLYLKREVDVMSERLASEKAEFVAEQLNTQEMPRGLQTKHKSMLDQKSVLEAEIEAIRILRSWVEDEARRNQARAEVLEEVVSRWKWDTPT